MPGGGARRGGAGTRRSRRARPLSSCAVVGIPPWTSGLLARSAASFAEELRREVVRAVHDDIGAPTSASAFPASKRRSRASTATEETAPERAAAGPPCAAGVGLLERLPVQVRRLDGVLDQDRRSTPGGERQQGRAAEPAAPMTSAVLPERLAIVRVSSRAGRGAVLGPRRSLALRT